MARSNANAGHAGWRPRRGNRGIASTCTRSTRRGWRAWMNCCGPSATSAFYRTRRSAIRRRRGRQSRWGMETCCRRATRGWWKSCRPGQRRGPTPANGTASTRNAATPCTTTTSALMTDPDPSRSAETPSKTEAPGDLVQAVEALDQLIEAHKEDLCRQADLLPAEEEIPDHPQAAPLLK